MKNIYELKTEKDKRRCFVIEISWQYRTDRRHVGSYNCIINNAYRFCNIKITINQQKSTENICCCSDDILNDYYIPSDIKNTKVLLRHLPPLHCINQDQQECYNLSFYMFVPIFHCLSLRTLLNILLPALSSPQ